MKYGANCDCCIQRAAGAKAAIATSTIATTKLPFRRPSSPPSVRSSAVSPAAFMIRRARRPSSEATIRTAKKTIRNAVISPNHCCFKNVSNQSASRRYCQAAKRYPTTKPAKPKASEKKPAQAAVTTENSKNARLTQSATPMVCSERRRLNLQLVSRQLTIRFEILVAGPARNILGKGRRGRLFVPVNFFEVIPYILLVIRLLRLARFILVGRPETRRIRSENFICQCNALPSLAKFE